MGLSARATILLRCSIAGVPVLGNRRNHPLKGLKPRTSTRQNMVQRKIDLAFEPEMEQDRFALQ
jgi:hypothetical protein